MDLLTIDEAMVNFKESNKVDEEIYREKKAYRVRNFEFSNNIQKYFINHKLNFNFGEIEEI